MPIIVDDTVAGPNANSLISVAYGDSYFAGHAYPQPWDDATDDDKARAVVTATRQLQQLWWIGWPTTTTQALAFPRSGLTDRNNRSIGSMVIPLDVQMATAELARSLLQNADPSAPSSTAGIESIKAGSLELKFSAATTSGSTTDLPDVVLALIGQWLSTTPGRTSVPLMRA